MKTILVSAFILFAVIAGASGQPKHDKWNWLIGTWAGEGTGKPGQGEGQFIFARDLDGKIITRKSHTGFPKSEGKAKFFHDDLMIIYLDPTDKKDRAVYFDNEGHTIFYSIAYTDTGIVLTSDKIPDSPVFRLIYTGLGQGTVNVRFEMSGDGGQFMPYIEGKSRKINN